MPSERFTGLSAVLAAVRSEEGITQSLLVERVGLGRSVVAQRVAELEAAGLIATQGVGPSTGGRAPKRFRLCGEAGHVLGINIASNELSVAVADLTGKLVEIRREPIDVSDGPEGIFGIAQRMTDALLDETGAAGSLWSVALGMPGPVTFDADGSSSMPTMPAWDRFPACDRLAASWGAPVWMESRVILSALGERRVNPVAAASDQTIYLGGGEELGAALVLDGRVYRGARGLAGEIAHMPVPDGADLPCPCGKRGCLDALTGRAALVRDGRLLAEIGQSPVLAQVLAATGSLRPLDITEAADSGDPAAQALLHRSATMIGSTLAALVDVFNPDLLIVGGGMERASAHLLEGIRDAINSRALPAATQHLRIEPSALKDQIGDLIGAVQFAVDGIFSPDELSRWLGEGSPSHHQARTA